MRPRAFAPTRDLNRMTVDLKDMVRDAERGLTHRFAEEAKGVRGTLQENTAVVRKRHRRTSRFWFGLADVALGLFAAGAGLQWRYEPIQPHDPSKGWRDYIWYEYGPAVRDCIRNARETGRSVSCLIPPPRR